MHLISRKQASTKQQPTNQADDVLLLHPDLEALSDALHGENSRPGRSSTPPQQPLPSRPGLHQRQRSMERGRRRVWSAVQPRSGVVGARTQAALQKSAACGGAQRDPDRSALRAACCVPRQTLDTSSQPPLHRAPPRSAHARVCTSLRRSTTLIPAEHKELGNVAAATESVMGSTTLNSIPASPLAVR